MTEYETIFVNIKYHLQQAILFHEKFLGELDKNDKRLDWIEGKLCQAKETLDFLESEYNFQGIDEQD